MNRKKIMIGLSFILASSVAMATVYQIPFTKNMATRHISLAHGDQLQISNVPSAGAATYPEVIVTTKIDGRSPYMLHNVNLSRVTKATYVGAAMTSNLAEMTNIMYSNVKVTVVAKAIS